MKHKLLELLGRVCREEAVEICHGSNRETAVEKMYKTFCAGRPRKNVKFLKGFKGFAKVFYKHNFLEVVCKVHAVQFQFKHTQCHVWGHLSLQAPISENLILLKPCYHPFLCKLNEN